MRQPNFQVKNQLLKALSHETYTSGEQLGQCLGISRMAISKHMKMLQSWGVEIESMTKKGYRLINPLSLLDLDRIESFAQERASRIQVFPTIDSTNTFAMNAVQKGEMTSGDCVLSEAQTAGKGRRGRQWQSPFAQNIYLSYVHQVSDGVEATMGLSLVVAIAVHRAIRSVTGLNAQLKWPNDILYQQKKLAGILVELFGPPEGPCTVIIGVGVNVNMPLTSMKLDQPWTSLNVHSTNELVDRTDFVQVLITELDEILQSFAQTGLSAFMDEWHAADAFLNQTVRLISGPQSHQGISRGINEQGALLVEHPEDDGIKVYFGGEVSLRGDN
ncbi:bifunctional biotin--[acetyl-CoA-carboxylase] ligase/biotin operon repressor BirA [Algicola sagamiensis]|uniref:bifunctional biotin--[acetyl-CoA-carboxylase] ligase/biotin operon repressor BirA n=1 Tax=Algicola sagamiensis TaxID=163869 RepID=UPI00036A6545|nr:bifunctional biotin--[acetyl-CoA-carboxylase] ligase/biotin operon repressor BirA [Algicola sagamiensis]